MADQFISQYYTVLSDYPRYMHRFYRSASSLLINETRGDGSQEVVTASSEKVSRTRLWRGKVRTTKFGCARCLNSFCFDIIVGDPKQGAGLLHGGKGAFGGRLPSDVDGGRYHAPSDGGADPQGDDAHHLRPVA